MASSYSKQNVGIIGCGASGLVTLKELHAEGHTGTIFERMSSIGGIFNTVYQQGHMVSSTIITMFSDFLGSDGEQTLTHPRMMSFAEYTRYLNEYAWHFDLIDHIRFEHNVTLVERTEISKWRIHVLDLRANVKVEYTFDRLVVCTGTNQLRVMPSFIGTDLYKGTIRHMQDVKRFEEFTGKRVCVIGSGEAAADMALAAAKHGSRSFISIRRDHGYIVPRYLFGPNGPSDLHTNRVRYSIPLALAYIQVIVLLLYVRITRWFRSDTSRTARQVMSMNWKQLRSSHFRNTYGTKNSGFAEAIVSYGCQLKPGVEKLCEHSIVFTDGTEEPIDEIICCTGFTNRFPFLDANNDDQLIQRVARDAVTYHNLYKHMIHPLLGSSLVFIGFVRPCFGAIPPLAEMQARWFALLCSNRAQLPDVETMIKRSRIYVQYIEQMLTPYRTDRMPNLTDFISYSDDLARQIGCRPSFGFRMLFSEPRLWLRCMLGPICNAQYRLTGPHKQPDKARHILYTLKWDPAVVVGIEFVLLCLSTVFWLCGVRKCKPLTWYPIDEWKS